MFCTHARANQFQNHGGHQHHRPESHGILGFTIECQKEDRDERGTLPFSSRGSRLENPRPRPTRGSPGSGVRPLDPSPLVSEGRLRKGLPTPLKLNRPRAPPEDPRARTKEKPAVGVFLAPEAKTRERPRLRPLQPQAVGWPSAARLAGGRGHSPHHAVGAFADVREVGVARPHIEHLPADHLRARARRRRRRRHVGCRAAAAASAALGSMLRGRRSAPAALPGGPVPSSVQSLLLTGKEERGNKPRLKKGAAETAARLDSTACLTDGRAGGRAEGGARA